MGDFILSKYMKCKLQWKLAFISTFVFFFLTHSYVLFNNLMVTDTLIYPEFYSSEVRLQFGRWFLSPACGIGSFYDLPPINGVLSCIYLAISNVIIVELFHITKPVAIFLTSGIITSSIYVGGTLLWTYTCDGYFMAMLFSCIAFALSVPQANKTNKISHNRSFTHKAFLRKYMLPIAFLCLSCGIYQAYITFYIVLAVFYFINLVIQNKLTTKQAPVWIFNKIIILGVALALYYAIWMICLKVTDSYISEYQGIREIGEYFWEKILKAPALCYSTMWNYLRMGTKMTVSGIFFTASYVVFAAVLFIVLFKKRVYKKKLLFIIIAAAFALLPCFTFIWFFVSDQINYHPIMCMSLVLPLVFTISIVENYSDSYLLKNIVLICLSLATLVFAIDDNIMYKNAHMTYESSYATAVEMKIRIDEEMEKNNGELPEKIIIFGFGESDRFRRRLIGEENLLGTGMPADLLYDQTNILNFFHYYFKYDFKVSSFPSEEVTWEDIEKMSVWPSSGSVKLFGETIVVKLSRE